MKLALFNDSQLGIVRGERIYNVSEQIFNSKTFPCPMLEFIQNYSTYKPIVESEFEKATSFSLDEVKLKHPILRPGKIVATPVNYLSHKKEMNVHHTARGLGFFLKANTSLIGPDDEIVLPFEHRRIDHELELAFVIGKKAKNVKREEAFDYIFGYTGLNDVTLRPDGEHEEERCLRKSFDTFTPMGPWLVTKDEIADPQNLQMSLFVNDELRQQVNTKDMICPIAELVEIFSHVMTLEPGDIIATGTPDGVGPIKRDDVITIDIEQVGSFSNRVTVAR